MIGQVIFRKAVEHELQEEYGGYELRESGSAAPGSGTPPGCFRSFVPNPGVSLRSTPGYRYLNPSDSFNQWFPKDS
jgi:hypothetical protein